jgi:hypothetical protein
MPRFVVQASACLVLALAGAASAQPPAKVPHLSQAWIAESSGDGLPGETGLESYLYEDCPHGATSDECKRAHIFNYGANNCIKIEIDAGFHSNATGTYLVKCDAVDCCYEGDQPGEPPDVKQWDIFHANGKWNPTHPEVKYLGKKDTTELNDTKVPGADVWSEKDHLPFTKDGVNYTYYITEQDTDVISHRIDFVDPTGLGSILYGNFQVQHDLDAFRKTFVIPDACYGNIMACQGTTSERLRRMYHPHTAARKKSNAGAVSP